MSHKISDIRVTLDERGKRYGAFDGHAAISQALQTIIKTCPKYEGMQSFHKEALSMICHKIGRIMNGDENYDDNYRDIAGYAQLVVDILNGENKKTVHPMDALPHINKIKVTNF